MEVSAISGSLNAPFLIAQDVLATGLLREVYSDGTVAESRGVKTVTEIAPASSVTPAVEVSEALAPRDAVTGVAAPGDGPASVSNDALARAVARAEAILNGVETPAVTETPPADRVMDAARNALIGPPPTISEPAIDSEPAVAAGPHPVAPVETFRDATGKRDPGGDTARAVEVIYRRATRAYGAAHRAPFVV